MSVEYFNIDLERKVLKCVFHSRDLMIRFCNKGMLKTDIFSDKSFRSIFSLIERHFIKTGERLDHSALSTKIERLKFKKGVKPKDVETFRERLRSVLERQLSKKPTEKDMRNFEVYLDELVVLLKGRNIQNYIMDLADDIDNGQIEEAEQKVNTFHISSYEDIEESEITANFVERENYVLERYNNPEKYKLIPTGIPDLDIAIGGGVGKELLTIAGSSNTGKSFFLQSMAAYCRKKGFNVILFTIEMQLLETQFRIDCNLSNMDYKFFRNPAENYNSKIHNKWKRRVDRLRNKPGKLQVVAFKKNAKMSCIRSKVRDLMNEWQEPVDLILIDYLDDIEPEKSYREHKHWASFGEISWDMHMLAKYFPNFDGTTGVATITANQLSKKSKEISSGKGKRKLDERDTGSSPLPFRHSDIYLGIHTLFENDLSSIEIMKGRFHDKGGNKNIVCFHKFSHGMFHYETNKEEFIKSLPEHDKKILADVLGLKEYQSKGDDVKDEEMEVEVEE